MLCPVALMRPNRQGYRQFIFLICEVQGGLFIAETAVQFWRIA